MELKFNKEELNEILNDFHNVTGLNIRILDTNYNEIGKNEGEYPEFCNIIQRDDTGVKRCHCSDEIIFKKCAETKSIEIHNCHAGLTDMAVPVIRGGTVIAFIILGQIKNNVTYNQILQNTNDLNFDKALLEESYNKLIEFDTSRINSIANIAVMIAEHILLNDMLKLMSDAHIQRSFEFIEKNMNKPISITDLCEYSNISKSVLYKSFQKHLNTSPNQYINEKKIAKAKDLINNTEMPIKEIADNLGFTNTTYFYKLFKKVTGITPIQYKKQIK